MILLNSMFHIVAQTAVDPNKFNNFMMLGYGVMWAIGALYIFSLRNRQKNIEKDLALLQDLVDNDTPGKRA